MAKKKAKGKARSTVSISCGPEYRAWLERLVAHVREEKVTNFVVKLISDCAAKRGFEKPPPRQT